MISYLKSSRDRRSFYYMQRLGFPVYEIEDLEKVDDTIKELRGKNYSTIVISNELAGFSEDIIKKYQKQNDFNIIIARQK